jgi:hypothetical protein
VILVRLALLLYLLWLFRGLVYLGLPGVAFLAVMAWLILPEPEPPPRR